jgi:hypothetical protein
VNPIVASYGGGVNSTAMLIGMVERGERVDLILFSDTGGEKPETYSYVSKFARWLVKNGMPPIRDVAAPNTTLEGFCLRRKVLPPIAFGFKTCSQRFKSEPQNKFLNHWQPAIEAWKSGGKVVKLIGYDAGEPHRVKDYTDDKFTLRYPLVEWGWDREECLEAIARAGICHPPKSSCFYCPNMKPHEVLELKREHPDLFERALEIERRAMPGLISIKGLGRGNFSWDELSRADDSQIKMFGTYAREMPCECYDGE